MQILDEDPLDAKPTDMRLPSTATSSDGGFLRAAHSLLVRLCQESRLLPSSLFIEGVFLPEASRDAPLYFGGFGDIFEATYEGRAVALKRLRLFSQDSPETRTERYWVCLHVHCVSLHSHHCITELLSRDHCMATATSPLCFEIHWRRRHKLPLYELPMPGYAVDA